MRCASVASTAKPFTINTVPCIWVRPKQLLCLTAGERDVHELEECWVIAKEEDALLQFSRQKTEPRKVGASHVQPVGRERLGLDVMCKGYSGFTVQVHM
jgi:hypothetical protein